MPSNTSQQDGLPSSAVMSSTRSGSVETIVSSTSNVPLVGVQDSEVSYGFKVKYRVFYVAFLILRAIWF